MPNAQYYNAPYPSMNWSSEISTPQPTATAHAHSTTSTTTTTTSSSSAGTSGIPGPVTTTTTDMGVSTPAAQQPQSYPAAGSAPSASPTPSAPTAGAAQPSSLPPRNEFEGSLGTLDLETHQPIEVIEAPTSMNEAFLGSLKSMLLRNRGNFVTATFLIGSQGTTAWEGILHDVGNDYIIIFQPGRQRYIACDIYSLKYIEFYDTSRRQMCDELLRQQQGWQPNG